MEFTKESKAGGGGLGVQDSLRIAQNCFCELLRFDLTEAYQLGFLYIRQLCLHLRNIRNNMGADAVKNIYSWQFFNCVKLWVLALCRHKKELTLLIHPVVQLIIGTIKLTNNIKYFPFHVKLFQLISMICQNTNEFVPASQYMLYPFEQNVSYLNSKAHKLEDKMLPETLVSIKISKKHINTIEQKDRIVKESLEELLDYLSGASM